MKPVFLQREISTGTNSDDAAFFANALANPPIPPDVTLEQARDVLDSLASLNPAIPADVVTTQVDANGASAELLTPPNARGKRVMIYARGGGYINGRNQAFRALFVGDHDFGTRASNLWHAPVRSQVRNFS